MNWHPGSGWEILSALRCQVTTISAVDKYVSQLRTVSVNESSNLENAPGDVSANVPGQPKPKGSGGLQKLLVLAAVVAAFVFVFTFNIPIDLLLE